MRTPPGFRRRGGAGALVLVAETFDDEIEALSLTEPGGLARWLEDARATAVAGGRARGWRVTLPSGRVVHLRELAHGGWLRPLTGRRFLALTRGRRALEAAARLRARGLDVPEPVLLRAVRHGPFWHMELATGFVEACLPAGRFLLTQSDPRRTLAAARAAGRAVRAFHDAGGSHPDLHVDNLLVRVTHEPPSVVVTDLEGVRVGRPLSPARRARELLRLHRSLRKRRLRDSVRRRHAAAFLTGYVSRDRSLLAALLAQPPLRVHLARAPREDRASRSSEGEDAPNDGGSPEELRNA